MAGVGLGGTTLFFFLVSGFIFSEKKGVFWWAGIGSVALSALLFLAAPRLSQIVRRAYRIHFFFALVLAIWQLPLWLGGIRSSITVLAANSWILIGAGVLSTLAVCKAYYEIMRSRLRRARKYNQTSGRLDEARGSWDLQATLHQKAPQAEEAEVSRWQRIQQWVYPFGPAIGYAIANNFSKTGQELIQALLLFYMAYLAIDTVALHLAIAADLKELEIKLEKEILLPQE